MRIEDALKELQSTARVAAVRRIIDELVSRHAVLSATERATIAARARQVGIAVPEFRAVDLAVGESWLLLYESSGRGRVVRMRAGDNALGATHVSETAVRAAYHGLMTSAAQQCRRLMLRTVPTFSFDRELGVRRIEGSSLGLSACVAMLSMATKTKPRADTAGSAQVAEDGRLYPVERLAEKIVALREDWPEVRYLVVANNQPLSGECDGLTIVRCERVSEAISHFGLTVQGLEAGSADDYRQRVATFALENGRARDAQGWQRLAEEALQASVALEGRCLAESAEARLWCALFMVHAGDACGAERCFQQVKDEQLHKFPELVARKRMTECTQCIDAGDLERAVSVGKAAVELSRELSGSDRRALLGLAYGTLGRALLHKGELVDAENWLRAALEHHETTAPEEVPRSGCYLATCERHAGKLHEALKCVNEQLDAVAQLREHFGVAQTTALFLLLERARIYIAQQRWEDAERDLLLVRDAQSSATGYPRLGAVRELAKVWRSLGRAREAKAALGEILDVIESQKDSRVVVMTALVGIGEALLESGEQERARYESVWRDVTGQGYEAQAARELIGSWIY